MKFRRQLDINDPLYDRIWLDIEENPSLNCSWDLLKDKETKFNYV